MSYPINYPTPQGANIQIFKEGGSTSDWVKPQGASFVWFTLIGAGGDGVSGSLTGGGSGAVTNFMGPAFLMPDVLKITVGARSQFQSTTVDSSVFYQAKDGTGYPLLYGYSSNSPLTGSSKTVGGTAMAANAFTAMGFFQSIAGQNGTTGASTASATTFLSGGGAGTVTANYGYSTGINDSGYFQMQPIIVGVAGGGGNGNGGIGCGGGYTGSGGLGLGGNGMVVIITW